MTRHCKVLAFKNILSRSIYLIFRLRENRDYYCFQWKLINSLVNVVAIFVTVHLVLLDSSRNDLKIERKKNVIVLDLLLKFTHNF